MAATKKPTTRRKTTTKKSSPTRRASTKATKGRKKPDKAIKHNGLREEIIIFAVLAAAIVLLISNFGIGGVVGRYISFFFFGVFGLFSYILPLVLFFVVAFYFANINNPVIFRKMMGAIGCVVFICGFLQLLTIGLGKGHSFWEYYMICATEKIGGGILGAFQAWLLGLAFGTVGAYVIIVIGLIISAIIMTQRSLLIPLKKGSAKAYKSVYDNRKKRQLDQKKAKEEVAVTDKKVTPSKVEPQENILGSDNLMDELKLTENSPLNEKFASLDSVLPETNNDSLDLSDKIKIETSKATNLSQDDSLDYNIGEDSTTEAELDTSANTPAMTEGKRNPRSSKAEIDKSVDSIKDEINSGADKSALIKADYKVPPLTLLKKGTRMMGGTSVQSQRATALKLQQTLKNFGVNVTVSDVSCGPAVTRYELQPEQGVKVSKIVNLSDDIKLNLAAADIRIEAPIPGKAAVGIEVPNDTNSAVFLRDLLDTKEFQDYPSPIAFAVGKDIAGQPVIADIAKMPHLLIAGATGSGKSVCINTLIMSIVYKANPDDVKLIMIDPKVVELSVYNGIPHLLLPVVTDPKKAAGALNWAVGEMTKRYNLFAEYNVRDLKGYNAKLDHIKDIDDEEKPEKMPQIVVIVDELADLMMVAPGEVEDAICRLAQLARAAGIHLVVATQRPSVNVITGLIKANMPSRIAFSVSSGVDSRTILDMHGAEKLLGKGDMLFYPQGYQKPARVQGSFVSDKEVASIVDYLDRTKSQEFTYDEGIKEQIENCSVASSATGATSTSEVDDYFADAGRFIIEKDKASIGMLQRVFKIGFNRAARIMDQLCEVGVVGEEEGTKPRKVLMTMESFEEYISSSN